MLAGDAGRGGAGRAQVLAAGELHVAAAIAAAEAVAGEAEADEEEAFGDDEEEEGEQGGGLLPPPPGVEPAGVLALATAAAARIATTAQTRQGRLAAVRLLRAAARGAPGGAGGAGRGAVLVQAVGAVWAAVAGEGDRLTEEQVLRVLLDSGALEDPDLVAGAAALAAMLETALAGVLAEAAAGAPLPAPALVLLDAAAELWLRVLLAAPALDAGLVRLMPRLPLAAALPGAPADVLARAAEAYVLHAGGDAPPALAAWLAELLAVVAARAAAWSTKELRSALALLETWFATHRPAARAAPRARAEVRLGVRLQRGGGGRRGVAGGGHAAGRGGRARAAWRCRAGAAGGVGGRAGGGDLPLGRRGAARRGRGGHLRGHACHRARGLGGRVGVARLSRAPPRVVRGAHPPGGRGLPRGGRAAARDCVHGERGRGRGRRRRARGRGAGPRWQRALGGAAAAARALERLFGGRRPRGDAASGAGELPGAGWQRGGGRRPGGGGRHHTGAAVSSVPLVLGRWLRPAIEWARAATVGVSPLATHTHTTVVRALPRNREREVDRGILPLSSLRSVEVVDTQGRGGRESKHESRLLSL